MPSDLLDRHPVRAVGGEVVQLHGRSRHCWSVSPGVRADLCGFGWLQGPAVALGESRRLAEIDRK